MTQAIQVGALALSGDYTILGDSFAPNFPDAQLNDFGKSAQLAGAHKYEAHYSDPSWELSVLIGEPTRDLIDDLMSAFSPGAAILWTEPTGSSTTYIRTVESLPIHNADGSVIITFSGTRSPAWETTTSTGSGTITAGSGTLSLGTPGGQLAAKMSLKLTCAAASKLIGCGVRPDPAASYDPVDDYSGAADAAAYGGAWSADASLSGTAAAVGTAPTISVSDNRGSHVVCARVKTNAVTPSATKFRARSGIGSAFVDEPYVAATAATCGLMLGTLQVPSYVLPDGTSGSRYAAQSTTFSQTAEDGTSTASEAYIVLPAATQERLHSIDIKPVAGSANLYVYRCSNATTIPPASAIAGPFPITGDGSVQTITMQADTTPGTYYALYFSGNLTWRTKTGNPSASITLYGSYTQAGDGTITLTGASTVDPYIVVREQSLISFDATTPVQATCSESSKTGTIDHLVRLPADNGGFTAAGTFGSGTGVYYDGDTRIVYPADGTGVTGVSLMATVTPFGTELAPIPNVANTLVVFCDAVDNITASWTITERRINRG